MSCYDRVAIGGELLLFDHPGARPQGAKTDGEAGEGEEPSPAAPPTAEFAVEELQAALRNKGKQAQEVRYDIAWGVRKFSTHTVAVFVFLWWRRGGCQPTKIRTFVLHGPWVKVLGRYRDLAVALMLLPLVFEHQLSVYSQR